MSDHGTIEFAPREIEITRSFESDDLSEKGLREFQSRISNGQSEASLIKDLIGVPTAQMWIKASWSKFQQFIQRIAAPRTNAQIPAGDVRSLAREPTQKTSITTTYLVEPQPERRGGY